MNKTEQYLSYIEDVLKLSDGSEWETHKRLIKIWSRLSEYLYYSDVTFEKFNREMGYDYYEEDKTRNPTSEDEDEDEEEDVEAEENEEDIEDEDEKDEDEDEENEEEDVEAYEEDSWDESEDEPEEENILENQENNNNTVEDEFMECNTEGENNKIVN